MDLSFLVRPVSYVVSGLPKASARAHAGRATASVAVRRVRTYSRPQASTRWSTSSGVLAQPRLTRIALAASSGSTPIAARTWDGPTLPDEQAEPVLTAMPARSSSISWVWLLTPGIERHEVLGKRS